MGTAPFSCSEHVMKSAHRHMWIKLGYHGPPPEPLALPWFRWTLTSALWISQDMTSMLARVHWSCDVRRGDMA